MVQLGKLNYGSRVVGVKFVDTIRYFRDALEMNDKWFVDC